MTLYRVTARHPSNGEGETCTVETDSPTKAEAYYRTVAGGIPSSWEVEVLPLITLQMPLEDWEAVVNGIENWAGRPSPEIQILADVTQLSAPASLDMSKVPDFARAIIEAEG